MIIFREKIFRRDEFTDDDKILPNPDIEKSVGKLKIRISTEKKYENDTQKLGLKGTPNRRRLEDLKDSIRKGYLAVDGNHDEEKTHYLGDYSKEGSYMFSKRISDEHRLNYRVFPPRVIIDSDKQERYIQDVVLVSCYGHETEEGDYLNDKNLRARKNRMRGNAPYRKPESIMKKKKKIDDKIYR